MEVVSSEFEAASKGLRENYGVVVIISHKKPYTANDAEDEQPCKSCAHNVPILLMCEQYIWISLQFGNKNYQ